MSALEWAALSIVAFYLFFQLREHARPAALLSDLLFLAAAAWLTEESAILLYGFYRYSPAWSLTLAHVPLAVALIWPVILHSARDLASQLGCEKRRTPIIGAAIVFTDALLIEPIAVRAGLWSWSRPGTFGVPLIGILGWGYFSYLSLVALEKRWVGRRPVPATLVPLFGTHALLLASWWGALRWVDSAVGQRSAAAGVWVLSILLAWAFLRMRRGTRVRTRTLLLRVPGALFFFTLLGLNARGAFWLLAYASAFVPPYLSMLRRHCSDGVQGEGGFSRLDSSTNRDTSAESALREDGRV